MVAQRKIKGHYLVLLQGKQNQSPRNISQMTTKMMIAMGAEDQLLNDLLRQENVNQRLKVDVLWSWSRGMMNQKVQLGESDWKVSQSKEPLCTKMFTAEQK